MKKNTTALMASAALLALGISSANAATDWIMASGYAESNFMTQNIRLFIDDVKKATGGELNITLHSNGTLIKLDGIRRAVQTNQVQIGEIRLGGYSNEDPMYYLAALPFVAPTYESGWKLKEAQKPYFDAMFGKLGFKAVAYQPWPGQGFFTKTPVESTADFKGRKIRIYSKATQEMSQMLGFEATILPFSEIPQAFATGLIDALFTSPQTGIDIQAWDNTKYYTGVGALYSKNAIIVNSKAFDALPQKIRDAVVAAGNKATERGWQMSKQTYEDQLKELASHGMVVTEAKPQIVDEMKKIGQKMLADWRNAASPEANAVVDAFLASQ